MNCCDFSGNPEIFLVSSSRIELLNKTAEARLFTVSMILP